MKKLILICMLATAASITSIAQTPGVVISDKPGWHKIAERHAAFKADIDEILVVGNNHFKQIKLLVKDAPVYINSVDVYFGNGTKQSIAVNRTLNAGNEVEPTNIDNTQSIKKVVLVYNSLGATKTDSRKETKTVGSEKEIEREREKETEKERAEVEIWGLK